MKKITSLILLMFFTLVSYSQIISTGFENGVPLGWIITNNGNGVNVPWTVNNTPALAHSGNSCMMVAPQVGTVANPVQDWLITSVADLNGIINPKVSFYGKVAPAGPTGNTKLEIRVSTTNTDLTSFTTIQTFQDFTAGATNPISPTGATYGFQELSLLPYVGENIYIAFVMVSEGSGKTWFLDDISVFEDCPDATELNAINIEATSATATWSNPFNVPGFEIDVMLASENPTSYTADYTSNTNSQPLTDLLPNTLYKYYIRSVCANNAYGDWIGPFTFGTSPTPAQLPYVENFENYHGWQYINGTQVNKWYVGTAVHNGGTKSLYISNDNGVNNTYTITTSSVTQAYREILIPSTGSQMQVSFDWRAVGEGTTTLYDYFRVWLVPATFTPTAGTQITAANSGGVQIGSSFNQQANWVTYNGIVNISGMSNSTRKLIFEWRNDSSGGTQPPAAIDNINVKIITCSAPTNLVFNNVTQSSAVVSWTAPTTTVPSSYDYFVSQTNTPPTDTTTPTGNVTGTTVTLNDLQPGQTYYVWVRGNCGTTNGNSILLGPAIISTTQIPAPLPYIENFDSPGVVFGFANGTQANKWMVGSNTFLSPNNSLYISNNNSNNAYTLESTSVTQAYRDILIPTGAGEIQVAFSWKGVGEGTTFLYDYMRVWLVPSTFTPTPGTQITAANSGGVQIGGSLNQQNQWTNFSQIVNVSSMANSTRRLVFEWRNDGGSGTQPPAAVDNINVSLITCSAPTNLVLNSVTQNSAVVSWTAPTATVPTSYDYFVSQTNTPPTDTTVPTGNVTGTTVTLNDLQPGQTYYVWVRGNCGATNGNSILLGPLTISTVQIPATLPYTENFDSPGYVFGFTNGTQANKWMVGSDTFLSPNNSLYISNNNSSNAYTLDVTSVSQAYRDISIPTGAGEIQISFDWKGIGEGTTFLYDYMRVWLVPSTFTPTPGTQITAANSGGVQIGGSLNQQNQWTNFSQIVNVSAMSNSTRRLVFEWRNDGGSGTQPPAAVDNINIKQVTCSAPSNLVLTSVTESTAVVTWTAPTNTVPASYDYFVTQTNTPPTDTTVPTGNVTGTTVTLNDLQPGQTYYVWVRGNCGSTNGNSILLGPLTFVTTQIPAGLPYFEDFDSPDYVFGFNNGDQVNKWMVGSDTFLSPNNSLYISNNNLNNVYTLNTTSVTQAYRDITIPTGINSDLAISFDWKGVGEGTSFVYDYMRVWIVPATFSPVAGTQITAANSGGTQLGGDFNQQTNWTNELFLFPASTFEGQTVRLVFEWRNDSGGGTQPPAAVDNIEVKMLDCPAPIDLVVTNGSNNSLALSWNPVGSETQWEVVIQPSNTGNPGPNPGTSVIVNNNPTYNFTPVEGVLYEFYVRAICASDSKSFWSGPQPFSVFNPPACADLDIAPLDLNVNQDGDYIFCNEEATVTVNLDATYDENSFKSTTSYDVESIDYDPPFPFTGGIEMNVSIDDTYAPPFTLPFPFCFYGNEFSTVQISSNGYITFGTNYCQTGGCSTWSMAGLNSFPNTTYSNQLRNVIMGVYQDIDPVPSKSPNASINYQVLGVYPCRALVVNYSEIALYGPACVTNKPKQNYQIVIYEITNIIEVYVSNRESCTTHDGGKGAIGLINADGSQATIPPGRNVGAWETQNEAWRFKPSGDTNTSFGWYMNGDLISENPQHSIEISESAVFEAIITYPGCGGDDLVLKKGFEVLISEEIIIPQVEEVVICKNNLDSPDRGRITQNNDLILAGFQNPQNYRITYYLSEANADADTNPIVDPEDFVPSVFPATIFVRVENIELGCYEIASFTVREGLIPVIEPEDVLNCTEFSLPDLPQGQKYLMYEVLNPLNHDIVMETRNNPSGGDDLPIGYYRIYIEIESVDGCIEVYSYKSSVVPCSVPKGISPNGDGLNDYLDLTYYSVQKIQIFNRNGVEVYSHGVGYSTEWLGQNKSGNPLPSGTYFYNIVTPYQTFTGWIQIVREIK